MNRKPKRPLTIADANGWDLATLLAYAKASGARSVDEAHEALSTISVMPGDPTANILAWCRAIDDYAERNWVGK